MKYGVRRKVLITGAGGMLGTALRQVLGPYHDVVALSGRPEPLDANAEWITANINDSQVLKTAAFKARPEVIVHAASSVAVNDCEKPEFRDSIRRLHIGVTEDLTEVSRELRSHFIYVSTESVYDGKKVGLYAEDDPVGPLNYYAATKLEGERVAGTYESAMVVRTNIFGWRTDGLLSFGEWVLEGLKRKERRTMFTDVTFTPLSTYCLADSIGRSIEKGLVGLFHAGGAELVSKYEFALRLAKRLNLSADSLVPCCIDHVPMGAPRPKNTGMNSNKLAVALGVPRPMLDQSIDRWLTLDPTHQI